KILDFGLAKLLESDSTDEGRTLAAQTVATEEVLSNLTLTRTGVAIGTAGYMSPEQIRGEKLDRRTDVFSFGLVLYEMATGKRAFKGSTGPQLHEAILNQSPVPVRTMNRELPTTLEDIINHALEKKCAARYQSVAELRADLEKLKRTMEGRRSRRLWAAALV